MFSVVLVLVISVPFPSLYILLVCCAYPSPNRKNPISNLEQCIFIKLFPEDRKNSLLDLGGMARGEPGSWGGILGAAEPLRYILFRLGLQKYWRVGNVEALDSVCPSLCLLV